MRISDWSSDVCSSDLIATPRSPIVARDGHCLVHSSQPSIENCHRCASGGGGMRSEERRLGKECVSTCSSRWPPTHYKKYTHILTIVSTYTLITHFNIME